LRVKCERIRGLEIVETSAESILLQDFLERIGFYARGIAEVAINQTIAPASNW
jgi:sulfur carrier protein ThiS